MAIRISGSELQPYISRIVDKLGNKNATRLKRFIELPTQEDGSYQLSTLFQDFFPNVEKSKALDSFKKLRAAINQAAEESSCSLRIQISSKAGDLSQRCCWFEAEPNDNPALQQWAEASSRQGLHSQGSEKSLAITNDPPEYRIFVSYAGDDSKQALKLIAELKTAVEVLTASGRKPYTVSMWIDRNVQPGDNWRAEIDHELEQSAVGLLLVSKNFLKSGFITKVERPWFQQHVSCSLEDSKPCVPVMLMNFDIGQFKDALGDLYNSQIYRYYHTNDKRYAYNECSTSKIKNAFIDDLAGKLIKRLDNIHASGTQAHKKGVNDTSPGQEEFAHDLAKHDKRFNEHYYLKTLGLAGSLKDANQIDQSSMSGREVQALDYLLEWTEQTPAYDTEFLAVLGEFGIGKTTTLHQFALALIAKRQEDAAVPLPIVFDLRKYTPARPITLEAVISNCIQDTVSDENGWQVKPADLIQAVRTQRAIAIFDGLDEAMNAMDRQDRAKFVKALWSILPPPERDEKQPSNAPPPERPTGRGRIIMSCRSHFFRDVVEQNGLYTGHHREGIAESSRGVLMLLPFTEQQVESYMKSCLGEEAGEKIYTLLQQVHNLIDLATRPVLADMIRGMAPELEAMMREKKQIQSVDLYQRFLRKNLDRDEGKHVFSIQHKLRMMESLAASLWISGEREWEWERLEQWLDEFLTQNPAILNRYLHAFSPEVLNQDFRNATAVVRPADSKSHFRFAHTSLQEYFLACWMVRSLESGMTAQWSQMPLPSDETLNFFGELLQQKLRDKPAAGQQILEALCQLTQQAEAQPNLLCFRYLLLAHRNQLPLPQPSALFVQHTDLRKWNFEFDTPLVLKGIDFSAANLSGTKWKNVRLQDCNLSAAILAKSQWTDCQLQNIEAEKAIANGAIARRCQFDQSQFIPDWQIECVTTGIDDQQATTSPIANIPQPLLSRMQDGHTSTVNSVVYDGDRECYVSAADDNTLKVWDAKTLQCVDTLRGHQSGVWSVVYDGDRGRYVSAAGDRTLKVWDANTLQCVDTLRGHQDWVRSVVYDGDRGRYVSAAADRTLKVWDANTLQCVDALRGHQSGVWSVAYDGDRGRYVSGAYDKTLKVWDANTLECVATIILLPNQQWVVQETGKLLPIAMSETASEHLKWTGMQADTQKLIALPYEGLAQLRQIEP